MATGTVKEADSRRLWTPTAAPLRVIDVLAPQLLGTDSMASNGKKKTTMAKLNRENRLRERRLDKQAKKDARKQASADPAGRPSDTLIGNDR
jgi:hypothetical protein